MYWETEMSDCEKSINNDKEVSIPRATPMGWRGLVPLEAEVKKSIKKDYFGQN